MSMLKGDGPYGEGATMKMAERCEPDYEAIIKRKRERLVLAVDFKEAALAYLVGQRVEDPMAQLIGELVTECNNLDHDIEQLIQDQEKDA